MRRSSFYGIGQGTYLGLKERSKYCVSPTYLSYVPTYLVPYLVPNVGTVAINYTM